MGFRFFRRIKLAPGLTLNLSKRGGSLSFGPRGAKLTVGTSGVRRTIGLPGTGLYYTEKLGARSSAKGRSRHGRPSRHASPQQSSAPTVRPPDRLDLGFFERLITPQDEEDFVDGMRQLVRGNEKQAYNYLRKAAHLADAAFMAGMLALKFEHFQHAQRYLGNARQNAGELSRHFAKYGIDAAVSLLITERISAHVGPSMRAISLALAEAHQAMGDCDAAMRDLDGLHQMDPHDPVVLLSLVELLVEDIGDSQSCQRVIRLTGDIDNHSEIHAAILLWKGKALRVLGLHTAARDTLTAAFRRKKGRSDDLLHAIRYERALVYEQLGKTSRARQEFEKLYAQAPDYEDVADRLQLAQR